jgi:hypothetical protein
MPEQLKSRSGDSAMVPVRVDDDCLPRARRAELSLQGTGVAGREILRGVPTLTAIQPERDR